MPFTPRQMIYGAIVAAIFIAGWKASSFLWENKYDSLVNSQAKAIVEMRDRLLKRTEEINESTAAREQALLRDLELARDDFELLSLRIQGATLVKPQSANKEKDAVGGVDIDWHEFARLYNDTSAAGIAAACRAADGSDAACSAVAEPAD